MTVLMGVLARCLYAIGDIALYRGVLGYEFSESALRKVCGGLFLAGFAGAMAVLPGAEYILYFTFALLVFGEYFLIFKAKFGLVVFSLMSRLSLTKLIDGVVAILRGSDSLSFTASPYYDCLINIIFIALILLAKYVFGNASFKIKETLETNNKLLWMGIFAAIIPAVSFHFGTITNGNMNKVFIINVTKDGLIGLCVVVLVILLAIAIHRKSCLTEQLALNERCIREQTEQYRILNEKQKELKAFRHDIKGHILAMRRMAAQGSSKELTAYLEKWAGLQEETFYISSNNIIGDAIFNFYYDKGCREGIEVKVMGKFLQDMDVAETDLCIVLTNTVSNAYEAALKCGKGSIVTIELSQFCGKAMIVITNPVKEEPKIQGGIMATTKADKELHGLGISNTMKALEKYDGQITWEKKGDKIVTKIVI